MSCSRELETQSQPELVPIQTAAQLLNVSTESILELVSNGTIQIDFKSAREQFQSPDLSVRIVDNSTLSTDPNIERKRDLTRRRQQRYRQTHQLPLETIREDELNLKQASNQSGFTAEYIRQRISMGHIDGLRKNGRWYITQDALNNFVQTTRSRLSE